MPAEPPGSPVQTPNQLPARLLEGAAPEPANRSSPAAPPFSWLGVDAWPHFPARADKQA